MSLAFVPSSRFAPIPVPLTPLVGREQEKREILQVLQSTDHRLVTIVGPGGVGKTRLALDLANTLDASFHDGAVFIPLAPIHDPGLVLPTIAQALGFHESTTSALEERIVQLLQNREVLLVLDNFEQVITASPAIASILTSSPDLTVLVTSQIPLGIAGEQQFPLLPLGLPDLKDSSLESIQHASAVELFVQRARAISHTFSLTDRNATAIASICHQLDGLPLAIELAAARTNILSPDALLARLSNRLQILTGDRRDVPARLRTMRQAIAWSYDLLSPSEQHFFRQLSVFTGGIPIDAVESLPVEGDALDLIGRLVDRSLLRRVQDSSDQPRFHMLQMLREYGLEQLALHGEENDVRARHGRWFRDLTRNAGAKLTGSDQEAWLRRYDLEVDNFRATVEWSLEADGGDIALDIFSETWRYWSIRGLATEGRAWTDRALHAREGERTSRYVSTLNGAGYLAEDQNQLDISVDFFTRAQVLAEEIGDIQGQCKAASGLGTVAHDRGEYDRAIILHQRSAELAELIGADRDRATALGNLGTVSYYRGDYDHTAQVWEESLTILRRIGDIQAQAMILSNLGALFLDILDLERAESVLQESLALQHQLHDTRSIAFTLSNLADLWTQRRDPVQAESLFAQALEHFRLCGDVRNEAITNVNRAELKMTTGEDVLAAQILRESLPLLLQVGDVLSLIEGTERLATLAAWNERFQEASELFGAIGQARHKLGAGPRVRLQAEVSDAIARCQSGLTSRIFEDAWQVGTQLSTEQIAQRAAGIAASIAANPTSHVSRSFPIAPPSSAVTPSEPVSNPLTAREMEILHLLAEGKSSPEIAAALFISPRTATTHVANILGKLDVNSRAAAVASAMRMGIL